MPSSDSKRLTRWARLLPPKEEEPQKELTQEDFEEATVLWSGPDNTWRGTEVRGPGPPYNKPRHTLPRNSDFRIHWDKKRGLWYWYHKTTLKTQYTPPFGILLQIPFTEEDYAEIGEQPTPGNEPEPPASPPEILDEPPEDPPLLLKGKGRAPTPIDTEQENPFTLATTSQGGYIPPLVHTPVQQTPASGSISLWNPRSPKQDSSPEPEPIQLPKQVITVHPFTKLPLALSTRLPPAVIHNISAFAGFPQQLLQPVQPIVVQAIQAPPMAAQPVTLADLTTAMNKLKGGALSFNGSGDALGFKNRMNLLITTKGITDDDEKLREWLGHLSGQALSWAAPFFEDLFNTTQGYVRVYNLGQFLAAFDRTYAYYNMQDKSRKQLDALQQGSKSVGNYVQQFQSLIHHTGYGVAEILQRFLRGLNKNIRHDLALMRMDNTLENAIEHAQRLELLRST